VQERTALRVPVQFEYERATSVDDALDLLARLGPDARLLAGGHSLLPMMKLRLATPSYLIDIDPLADELSYIVQERGIVRIGAMTRHRELLESPLLAELLPIFTDAEGVIADPIVRNRGTIGGALCQADPSEDLGAVCAAVDAQMVIRGGDGERTIDVHDFHRGPYRTAVGDAEMLIEIRVPLLADSGSAYDKVDRRVGDWAVVAAGARVQLDGGVIASGRIALVAVGNAITSDQASAALTGEPPSEELFARVAQIAAATCSPVSDQRGSVDYKRHVAGVLTERVLRRATKRALAGRT
jgi:carbon-monoxide dehydrogenase medium subunit